MNIEQAKEDIRKTILAYTAKTPAGAFRIPYMRQRPIFLMGPPGIGKTAIMADLAAQCGIGLVSYTMTHHTRQSAIGLPMISEETFGGKSYPVTRYTMSEIIASVYRQMEQTGLREGILFLDEINCISETLLPAVLQLLQYKSFGPHRLPEGWIIAAAGNQPRYNQSAKEFDTAILDRMKVIEVEPDLEAWKSYAVNHNIHPAVLAYLTINPGDFYVVETGRHRRGFVTARGWEDLSDMLSTLESLKLPVEDSLFGEYLRDEEIAERFSLFYRIAENYSFDPSADCLKKAGFEERLCIILFMADRLKQEASSLADTNTVQSSIGYLLEHASGLCRKHPDDTPGSLALPGILDELLEKRKNALEVKKNAGLLSPKEEENELLIAKEAKALLRSCLVPSPTDASLLARMNKELEKRREELEQSRKTLLALVRTDLHFIQSTLGEGQELFIFSSELYEHRELHDLIRRFDRDTEAELRARLDLQNLKARLL